MQRPLLATLSLLALFAISVLPSPTLAETAVSRAAMDEGTAARTLLDGNASLAERSGAAFALRQAESLTPESYRALLRVAGDDSRPPRENSIRRDAVSALKEHADHSLAAESIPVLVKLTGHADQFMRWRALFALIAIAPTHPDAESRFTAALEDKEPSVRALAIRGLVQPAQQLQPVLPALQRMIADPAKEPREEAYKQLRDLAYRNQQSAVDQAFHADLVKALADESPMVRSFAANSLNELSRKGIAIDDALPQLVENLAYDHSYVRKSAIYTLQTLGRKAEPAIPGLVKLLQNENPQVRYQAERTLRTMKSPAALEAYAKAPKYSEPAK